MPLKTFVINLERDTERMVSIDCQLRKLGLAYERVSAVYGKDMSVEERREVFSAFRWWCAMGRPVAPAEIGCALSHYKIYRQMVEDEKLPYCCILEDDIALSPQFNSTLRGVERWIDPMKSQVVILNDHQNAYGGLSAGIHSSPGGTCTDGYVLTRVAARNLLEANLPIIVPCDTWGRWVRQGRIELYHAVPAVVRQMQDVFGSMTSENRTDVSKLPLFKRILHKAKRAVGKTLDMCLMKITGR
ncbi:MAG: glycosyltransferase family 25 protein [Kiritimatiellae bacterium]|nr:glycosyltransferase family 25 protein [Kiritimatiellia bacterium]